MILAMAQHRLGHKGVAAESLASAIQSHDWVAFPWRMAGRPGSTRSSRREGREPDRAGESREAGERSRID